MHTTRLRKDIESMMPYIKFLYMTRDCGWVLTFGEDLSRAVDSMENETGHEVSIILKAACKNPPHRISFHQVGCHWLF
jgi:hypothetical protein